MRCGECGQENRDDARFCRSCGHPLPGACAACGSALPADAAFCDRCGARQSAPPSPAPASYTPAHLAARIRASRTALEGERKLVTVLFADVVGSTAIAERIDPEQMRALVDRCFGHMLEEVHRYEGTVNQFTGDGVMALFGAPLALEDAPQRAVRAALAIQRALAECREELRDTCAADLQVRIGVHTGLVVVGRIGNDLRMEYTAIGDTTNLAARLQGLAPPGGVVISEATERLTAGFFDTRDLGMHALKGKTERVRVFEVLGDRAVRDRVAARATSGLTPFAGRSRELAALGEAFAAADAGQGQVVFLVGEAGLGKSRLLHEFRAALGTAPHRWIEGRCTSYGRATAFLPVADAFRRTFDIDDRDDEDAAIAKIDAAVPDDLAWARPFVRGLLSLPCGDARIETLDAVTRRSETARALKALTLRAAATAPLVLVVEDLHWIDSASEEYLAFLADALPTTRVLLVLTHRPGYRHAFGDRSYHRRISLAALSAPDMAAMASAILDTPELPAGLGELLARKAEGNPFFVEEVTKWLLEQGVLRREDGHVVAQRGLADTSVPDSIHGVLMARLDRLADEPKRALQMASVIGREFAVRLLERVSEIGEQVTGFVRELRALELIYEKVEHPELAYMFKHALTHDVAYESILLQRRKELHRTIGRAIEELYGDRLAEHYETLAFHFTRGEEWERAFDYHRKAAAKALAAYANHAAITHCREALAIAAHLGPQVTADQRCMLEEMLGAAHMWVSEFGASGEAFRRAAQATDDPTRATLALGYAANAFVWAHEYDTGRRTIHEAQALAEAAHVPVGQALAIVLDGFTTAVCEGDLVTHRKRTEQALALLRTSPHDEVRGFALFQLGEGLEWQGEFARSLVPLEEVVAIGKRLGHPFLMTMSIWWLGKSTCCLGHYARALDALQEAEALCARIGNRAWQSRLLNTLGWCFGEIGDHAAAQHHNLEAARLASDIGDPEILANSQINLALNHLALGQPDAAGALLAPLAEALEAPGDPWMRWRYRLHALDAVGRLALVRGEPERALDTADRELGDARRHTAAKVEARALELRGRALLDLDRREEARDVLTASLEIARRLGYPPLQWRALGLLATVAHRDGMRADADAHRTAARSLVDPLARPLPAALRDTLWATALADHGAWP